MALAATMVAATPADAKKKDLPPPAPVAAPQVALPDSPNGVAVRYFYERRNYAPIWFKQGGGDEAIAQLLSILNNASVDGMANFAAIDLPVVGEFTVTPGHAGFPGGSR